MFRLGNGLEILGFWDEMRQHIDHFEGLFVVKKKQTSGSQRSEYFEF